MKSTPLVVVKAVLGSGILLPQPVVINNMSKVVTVFAVSSFPFNWIIGGKENGR